MTQPEGNVTDILLTELRPHGSASFAASQRRYALRGTGTFLGVPMKKVRAIGKTAFKDLDDHSIDAVHEQCEILLATTIYELKTIAIQWSHLCKAQALPRHMETYGSWLHTYIDEWMDCDDLCTHPIASLVLAYPETLHATKSWACDGKWVVRRAAAVSLVPAARKGAYIDHILDLAELLQKDGDPMVQKGIGWLLRVARKANKDAIESFLEDYKRTMSPAIAREALRR